MQLDFENIPSLASTMMQYLKRFQFNTKRQLAFLEDFYLLISDGIPANRAIEMMAEVTTGLTRDVALSIAQKISEGRMLADGMRDWFSLNIVEIIRVGEEGGVLAETLQSAISTLGQRSSSLGGLISAISYPLLVILMACCVIVYLNNSVFVQFSNIKPMEEWPDAGRELVSIANFIQLWWWVIILLIVAVIVTFRQILDNYAGVFRSTLDKFPPFNFYRRLAAARLMETLGLLIANGIVFKNALKVMQYQANPYVSSHLLMMEHLLGMGKGNVADVLSTGLIDNADILRLRVMAEVKGFEHGLVRMGVRGSEQTVATLKILSKIVGGILLVIGAFLVITIIRGIFLTGMSMGTA